MLEGTSRKRQEMSILMKCRTFGIALEKDMETPERNMKRHTKRYHAVYLCE